MTIRRAVRRWLGIESVNGEDYTDLLPIIRRQDETIDG